MIARPSPSPAAHQTHAVNSTLESDAARASTLRLLLHFVASGAVDEESVRLRRRVVRRASARRAGDGSGGRRLRRSSARCRAWSTSSTTWPIAPPISSIHSSGCARSPRAGCHQRRRSLPRRSSASSRSRRPSCSRRCSPWLPATYVALLVVYSRGAEAPRDHRRPDDRRRLRASRRRGRRRGVRANQPLAARLHDAAGAVSRAQQAPPRADAPRPTAR